jgi:hypothetical protein
MPKIPKTRYKIQGHDGMLKTTTGRSRNKRGCQC